MNIQTHNAALRAAARVAFSITVLGGCGGSTADNAAGANGQSTSDPNVPSAESGYTKGGSTPSASPTTTTTAKPTPTPTPTATATSAPVTDASVPPKASCDSVLTSAFADAGFIDSENVSPDVRDCCVAELIDGANKSDPDAGWIDRADLGPHGFLCCEATHWGSDTHDQRVQIACTPWGPPVPPSSRFISDARRRARHARLRAA